MGKAISVKEHGGGGGGGGGEKIYFQADFPSISPLPSSNLLWVMGGLAMKKKGLKQVLFSPSNLYHPFSFRINVFVLLVKLHVCRACDPV